MDFKSLIDLLGYFKDENSCKEFLSSLRWGYSPTCPHCGSEKVYTTNRGFKCGVRLCNKKFTVLTGTIFEKTKIPLRVWFAAMYLLTSNKSGISSLALSRQLNISQKTAWYLLYRIREMLKEKDSRLIELASGLS